MVVGYPGVYHGKPSYVTPERKNFSVVSDKIHSNTYVLCHGISRFVSIILTLDTTGNYVRFEPHIHGAKSQKTAFFIIRTYLIIPLQLKVQS